LGGKGVGDEEGTKRGGGGEKLSLEKGLSSGSERDDRWAKKRAVPNLGGGRGHLAAASPSVVAETWRKEGGSGGERNGETDR